MRNRRKMMKEATHLSLFFTFEDYDEEESGT